MSYRCDVCECLVPPGRARLTHPVTRVQTATHGDEVRRRTEIARELAVCPACKAKLEGGLSCGAVRQELGLPVPAAYVPPTVNRPVQLGAGRQK